MVLERGYTNVGDFVPQKELVPAASFPLGANAWTPRKPVYHLKKIVALLL